MAYGEFYVEHQGWARWPKVLIVCRKRGEGIERKRYVPERIHSDNEVITNVTTDGIALEEQIKRQAEELNTLKRALEQCNSELRAFKYQAEWLVVENQRLRELKEV